MSEHFIKVEIPFSTEQKEDTNIIANGNDSHVFELTMSGSYRIYIQNETTESVHVEGAYSTY